ncbi:ankyrin repeat protein [Cotonvirus japonicus]|uniref:Ankyrin repeat protein n=1 Tax=Cotonvirus japonicus TaxID=2811091 RepID=A0ABM7NR10_9VIRU|nr:ankyrin repeat protein [Cotonvirus japonicus]BCS82591.1 ankyrin repeat protein [Cotonvirus japonicus]
MTDSNLIFPPEIWIYISDYVQENKLNLFFTNTDFLPLINLLPDYHDVFIYAVQNNYIDIIKHIIYLKKINPNIVDFIYINLDNGIYEASKIGHIEIIKYLISLGEKDNSKHIKCSCNRSIVKAAKKGYLDIVKYFISIDVDINYKNQAVFRKSAKKGHLDIVKYLVELGVDIQIYNNDAIKFAAFNGHLNIVKFLVEKGANINAEDNFAISYAACNGHLEMVKYLVEKGANIYVNDHFAYRMAKQNKHYDIVKYFESLIINIDFINTWYALYYNPISLPNSKLLMKNFRKIIKEKEKTKSVIKTKREILNDFKNNGINISIINYNYH